MYRWFMRFIDHAFVVVVAGQTAYAWRAGETVLSLMLLTICVGLLVSTIKKEIRTYKEGGW
ncbi:hypothetical protein IMZ31_24030 (plasmid) [Pontibacillus sp. ALD_SL1]|uniref:hypothetical protein n=1 Tax=Pontibacillus sp. ALD_SL1 TaxID=2777185 RepID=UPI001A9716EE|nr:hypothetical protein [Pontibacillus sp. ALD_SL1]QST02522.1 hypothetical protein IMZ31_24030 [Pontibacillus sp. ALD_SL1]